ncbi:NnrS family protein [Shinella sp. S4-D37]|uniref:NnrS family protein n=1 Tax=Shinella sp. S4-D37 TaxID=3161999 RepID=UPI003466D275
MEHAGASRSMLMFHPAGIFFALAATIAVVLPWLWLLPLADPRLAHIRLGLFGFGGMAICGYVMTAQKAWTGHAFPVPALFSGALALGARLASLGSPMAFWPVFLLSLPVASMILWPVLRARRWDKIPLAMVPLLLVVAEAMLVDGWDIAGLLPIALAILIFIVGGRLVSSFAAEAHRRRDLSAPRRPPLWLGCILLGAGLLHQEDMGMLALLATALWIIARSVDCLRLGQANRMLGLGYAGLAPGMIAIAAVRFGLVPQLVQVHALTMATIGPMILAVAARITMRRSAGAELLPRRRHWAALMLIFFAALTRGLAELSGQAPILLAAAGFGWSTAWVLFLSVHMQALMQPAPFPLLSAERAARPVDVPGP